MSELLETIGGFAAVMVICTAFLAWMGRWMLNKFQSEIVHEINTSANSFKRELTNHADQSKLRMDLLNQAQAGIKEKCDQMLNYVQEVDDENKKHRDLIHGVDKRVAVLETRRQTQ